MQRTLSQEEKDEIRLSASQHRFSMEAAVTKLMRNGFDEATAKFLIIAELQEYKKDLFHQIVREKEQEEARKFLSIVVGMVSIIGPICSIESPLWYIAAVVIAGVAGFWAHKRKPVAGLLASIIGPIVYPLAHAVYFSGRTSYFRIEMVIPIIMTAVPAVIMYFIISAIVYPNIKTIK